MTARLLTAALALVLVASCGDGDGDGEERGAATVTPNPLVETLREGGNTLVIRHAASDTRIAGQELLKSCAFQRNLTERGKEQSRAIGGAIRSLKIPVGDVRASPLCRTRDTAKLAFGRVTTDRDLISPGVIGTEADDRRRAKALRAIVGRPPAKGRNRVLVTHTGNIGAALKEETVQEGETLVYGPGAKLAGRVLAEDWRKLAGP